MQQEHIPEKEIIFLTGDNLPALSSELVKVKKQFIKEHGDLNISEYHVEDIPDVNELRSSLYAMPFLSEKRLVILRGFPFSTEFIEAHKSDNTAKKQMLDDLENAVLEAFSELPDETVLILYSSSPDGRRKASKEVLKIAQVKKFIGTNIIPMMEERYKNLFNKQQFSYIFQRVGGHPLEFASALEKLALYSESSVLTKEIMFKLVPASLEQEVFTFIEELFSKRRVESLRSFEQLILQGENILKLLGLMVWQLEQLFFVKELLERKKTKQEIMDLTGIKPYSFQKVLPLTQKVSLKDIARVYDALVNFDRRLKNGTIQMEKDAPTEIIQAFSEVILRVF